MTTLFIIGNGFDLAHGLPTSYRNFFDFLESHNILSSVSSLEELTRYPGSMLWSDLENHIGYIDGETYMEKAISIRQETFEGLEYPYGANDTVTEHIEWVFQGLMSLPDDTKQWIKSVDLSDLQPNIKFSEYFNEESLFVNFNYTHVLENIYGINDSNVFHIHGDIDEPILGHNTQIKEYVSVDSSVMDIEEDDFRRTIYNRTNSFMEEVDKNVEHNIYMLERFLSGFQISEIIVFGLSFGDADLDYISYLNQEYPKVTWKYSYYRNKEESDFLIKLNKIGINKSNISSIDTSSF